MKKFLFCVATLAAIVSCSKAPVEENTPESGRLHDVTVEVSLGEDSRVAIDGDWGVNWEPTDKLVALDMTGSNEPITFEMIQFDERKAIFSGSLVGEDDYRLIYPDTVKSEGGNLLLDLTRQQAGAKMNYMISIKEVNYETANTYISLNHIGSVIDLRMKGLPVGDQIRSITVSGLYSTGTHSLVDENSDFTTEFKKSDITIVKVAEDAISGEGEASVRFNVLPTTFVTPLVAGDEIVVRVVTEGGDTLEQTITLAEKTYINRARHKALNCFNMQSIYWTNYAANGLAVAGEISTPEELAWLAKSVNSGTTHEGETFKLTADIDLSAHDWVTIGNLDHPFKGTFDGACHAISGMKINQPGASYQALFGYINSATIKNLSVSGEVTGNDYVGGVVGIIENISTVINCHSSVKVSGNENVGGVVGNNRNSSIITNCYNSGEVSGNENVGGVVGYNYNGTTTNCYSSSKITATGKNPSDVKGAVGKNYVGIVTNCYYDNILNSNIPSPIATGMTSDEMQSEAFKTTLNLNAMLYNFSATTKACGWKWTSGEYPTFDFDNAPYVEKFSGGYGTAERPFQISTRADFDELAKDVNSGVSYSGLHFTLTGDVDLGGTANEFTPIGTKYKLFSGSFDGAGHAVSGLYINQPGANYQTLFGKTDGATIKNLSVSGEVTGDENIGGIVGSCNNSTIANCNSHVNVTGNDSVGGITGHTFKSTLTNCYSSGKVTGESSVGGVAGYNFNCTITSCYWNSTVNSTIHGGASTSMTTDEMQNYKFVAELNTNAKAIEGACGWRETLGGFPKLVAGSNPNDQLEGLGQGNGLRK